jgi:hypothetical protein
LIAEFIKKPELQILINILAESGSLRVSYPLYELPLFRANPTNSGYSLKVLTERRDFDESVPSGYSSELPTWSDFYECFISSGIIRYENLVDFEKTLELYRRFKKGVVFAPDTNVFYHCFISSYRPLDGYQLVVAEGVKKEIEDAMNYKYRHRQLEELSRVVKNPSLLKEFNNRRTKKSRKAAYVALKEFERLKDRIIIAESVSEPAHNNDELIVKTLKRYDNMSPALVVFLTADIAVTDVAELEGLEYFLFKYPRAGLGEHDVTAYQLRTLIFNLSAVFGVIELNGILVFGEFGGKVGLDELKLVFPRIDEACRDFHFHLELSRKLEKIMGD